MSFFSDWNSLVIADGLHSLFHIKDSFGRVLPCWGSPSELLFPKPLEMIHWVKT